jgi:hypothetical protein
MNAPRRIVRIIDRLTLLGYPASEALVERGLRSGVRRLGRLAGASSRLLAPWLPMERLGESFDEGLQSSKAPAQPRGRVLAYPGRP